MDVRRLAPLLREALVKTGRLRLRVRGASMEPTLPAGGAVEARPLHRPLRVGDIVLFLQQDRLVAHRLVGRAADGWLTQGDSVAEPDPPIAEEQILAVITPAHMHQRPRWRRLLGVAWRWARSLL
ncbi:MAG: hypothetical protein GXP42_03005 [Chloroflexi bacterium]|nr:hypothetical protein [Chloroflexota bacterium]